MDLYQAIYDAVRSRISGGNVAEAVADVVRQSFDISNQVASIAQEFYWAAEAQRNAAIESSRPSVLFKPRLSIDGNKWCVLFGENLQEGIAAFGDSPDEAMRAFDAAWSEKRFPNAQPLDLAPNPFHAFAYQEGFLAGRASALGKLEPAVLCDEACVRIKQDIECLDAFSILYRLPPEIEKEMQE